MKTTMLDKILYIIFRLFRRLLGVFFTIISIALTLSLISFDINDSSFNTVSLTGDVSNWMGSFGAYSSDLMFQLIGISSFFLCLIIFSIGVRMSSYNGLNNALLKIILVPFCILSFSCFFSIIPQPDWWEFNSLGGVNGHFVLAKLHFFPKYLTLFLSLFLGVVSISMIMEISLSDWIYSFRYLFITLSIFSRKFIEKFKQQNLKSNNIQDAVKKDEKQSLEKKERVKKQIQTPINQSTNKTKKSNYQLPIVDLLKDRSLENKDKKISKESIDLQAKNLVKVLDDFGVHGNLIASRVGPVATLHEFEPEAGTKASRIIGLSDDIARSMSAVSARISTVLGKTSIGIEIPNSKREMIFLRELAESKDYKFSQNTLPIILGKDISGEIMVADLAKMPHLLIAGTTGSGKSVGLNVMILSLLYKLRPDECKFIMIDPKMLELSVYDGIPHLLAPVVTEASKAVVALKWVVAEMEERYRLMSSFAVRNVAGYNEKVEAALLAGKKLVRKVQTGYNPSDGKPIIEEVEFEPKKLPFIVVIVDEMADLMLVAGKEIENSVQRLAQMARASGIHIIMATQRPSVDVITGVIKANFPTRISFQVTSRIDSRTILGVQGAEQLLGQGDMIYMSSGNKMLRVHGPFCSDTEIENVVNFIKSQDLSEFEDGEKMSFDQFDSSDSEVSMSGFNDKLLGSNSEEDLYNQAVMIVRRDKKPSISYIQRQLRIGYNKAATLIEKMEENGVVTAPSISGKREIIEQ